MIIQREDQRSAARIARIDEQNRRENQRREIEELLLEVLRRMASSDKIPCANDSVLNFRGSGSGSFAQGDATTGTSEASTSEINPVDDPRSSRHFPEHPEIEQTLDATGGAPPSYSDSSARGELLDALQPEVLALFLDKKNTLIKQVMSMTEEELDGVPENLRTTFPQIRSILSPSGKPSA